MTVEFGIPSRICCRSQVGVLHGDVHLCHAQFASQFHKSSRCIFAGVWVYV